MSGSASSKFSGLPLLMMGRSPPRAGVAASPLRLKKMFGNAVKRCQATPIVTFRAITMSQVMEMTTFASATQVIAVSLAGRTAPRAWLIGVAQAG